METKKRLYEIILSTWNNIKSLFDTNMSDDDWEELIRKCNEDTKKISQQYGELESKLYIELSNNMIDYVGKVSNK